MLRYSLRTFVIFHVFGAIRAGRTGPQTLGSSDTNVKQIFFANLSLKFLMCLTSGPFPRHICSYLNTCRFTLLQAPSTVLIIKRTRCTNFSNLFWNETLHISGSSSIHNQEFCTVHTAMVYAIKVCWQLASRIRMYKKFITSHSHMNVKFARYICAYFE
jgi:hypothetical protein